jgi:hypothetical protein
MVVKGEKLGSRVPDWSIDVLWIRTGALFRRSNAIHPTLLSQHERLPRMTCHEHVCVMCIRFLLQGILRFESPRLTYMSNCFSCGCQDVVNLLDWWINGSCLAGHS